MVYNLLHLWLTFITFVVIVTFIVDYYIDGWYICGFNRFIWDSILLTPVKPHRLLGESTVLYFFFTKDLSKFYIKAWLSYLINLTV